MDLVAFEAFLKGAFSTGELRRWLFSLPRGREILGEMPGESASLSGQAHAATLLLDERSSFEPALFQSLRLARPNRVAEINALERSSTAAGAPAGDGTRQSVTNPGTVGQQIIVAGRATIDLGAQAAAVPRQEAAPPMKILFLASNPVETSRLTLDREIRGISGSLQKARLRDRFELVSAWAVRPADLQQELLTHRPTVVHFSGHGTKGGGIVLEARNGGIQLVSGAALASLLRNFSENIRIVVLNACFSDEQAQGIVQHIPAVFGIPGPVEDEVAVLFAEGLYRALGAGLPIGPARDLAQSAYELEGFTAAHTPRLRTRAGVDPAAYRLVDAA